MLNIKPRVEEMQAVQWRIISLHELLDFVAIWESYQITRDGTLTISTPTASIVMLPDNYLVKNDDNFAVVTPDNFKTEYEVLT